MRRTTRQEGRAQLGVDEESRAEEDLRISRWY